MSLKKKSEMKIIKWHRMRSARNRPNFAKLTHSIEIVL